MAINKEQKAQITDALAADLAAAKGVVFANYSGLTVKEFEDLRKRLRAEKAAIKVAKLTLMKRALSSDSLPADVDFSKPTAVAYSAEDEVTVAKILAKFAADTKKLEILSGILDGKLIDAAMVKNLAKLPGKQELYGQFVSVIAGPSRGLVQVLAGVERKLLYALRAIAENKPA